VLVFTSWVALALSLLAPWLVEWLAPTRPEFWEAADVVPPLAFAAVAFGGYIVMAIGVGRSRRTQFNWVVTGVAAIVNVVLNVALIPPFGMAGAAIATVAAYTVMFGGMTLNAQRVYPVPYQWRRVATALVAAVALTVTGRALDLPLAAQLALVAAYPLVLLPLGFYLPRELQGMRQRLKLS
jgi:O-antigen/teichoic acid export membrane protein